MDLWIRDDLIDHFGRIAGERREHSGEMLGEGVSEQFERRLIGQGDRLENRGKPFSRVEFGQQIEGEKWGVPNFLHRGAAAQGFAGGMDRLAQLGDHFRATFPRRATRFLGRSVLIGSIKFGDDLVHRHFSRFRQFVHWLGIPWGPS